MFIIGNFLTALAGILDLIINVYYILLIIRVILSWFHVDRANQLVVLLYILTEPVLRRIRRFLPPTAFDLSPIIAMLILYFINSFIVESLHNLGASIH
ncbi:MAG: YggT family protein [Fidelibacterota bacterium]